MPIRGGASTEQASCPAKLYFGFSVAMKPHPSEVPHLHFGAEEIPVVNGLKPGKHV
jgi:hypothetical protein